MLDTNDIHPLLTWRALPRFQRVLLTIVALVLLVFAVGFAWLLGGVSL